MICIKIRKGIKMAKKLIAGIVFVSILITGSLTGNPFTSDVAETSVSPEVAEIRADINDKQDETEIDESSESGIEGEPGDTGLETNESSPIMYIHFIDVGQGDSIFVDYGNYEILVDAGDNSSGNDVVNYISPFIDGNLELIIATHVHEDHIGGLDTVMNSFQTDRVIDSGDAAETATFNDYFAAIREEDCVYIADEDMQIDIGDNAVLTIIETDDGKSNHNNNSVIAMVDYQDIEILLTGDMESPAERRHLTKFTDIDVLKAGHHGSSTASCEDFLSVVKPETVIISYAEENTYRHPHKETMSRFIDIGASVYGTFKSGTIVMTTDGSTFSFNTDNYLIIEDAN